MIFRWTSFWDSEGSGIARRAQVADSTVRLTQKEFTSDLRPLLAYPELWAACQQLLSPKDIQVRQCKLAELCRPATVSPRDSCSRVGRVSSRAISLQGSDVYLITDLAKTVRVWPKATVSKYASSSHPGAQARGDIVGITRVRGVKIHSGAMLLTGWSDVACGDPSAEGPCRLGHVVGLMSSTLGLLCYISQWTSKFSPMLVRSSLGCGVYAFSEMIDHMPLPRKVSSRFADLSPGMIDLGDCESPSTT